VRSVLTVLVALAVTPVAWGADGEPQKALTSKGNATARSVVLKRGDLSTAFTLRTRPDEDLPKGVRCGALDESDLTITGRVVATLTIGGNRVRAYIDAIILQHGRIQSGVVFTSLGRPVGQGDELGLTALVADRMARANRPKGPTA
jgi:hypothetical protein